MEKSHFTSEENQVRSDLPSLESVENSIKFLEQMGRRPEGLSREKQQTLANQKVLKAKIIEQDSNK
jgi:hypothetical protein